MSIVLQSCEREREGEEKRKSAGIMRDTMYFLKGLAEK
jgi:hypothetical protein